ncbi:MAG: hypothetical protein VXW87_04350 [Pseudomonadota bacterium]|nr:hypothetical protein [Pseudomonadota bacterium]
MPKPKKYQTYRSIIKHLLWHQDPLILQEAKSWFEEEIWRVASLQIPQARKQLTISQLLALLPYFLTLEDSSVTIPIIHAGNWKQHRYNIEKISLTPEILPSCDRFFAYGLVPEDPNNQHLLIFKGTTYPTDSGFWSTIMADLYPFSDIGTPLIWWGKKHLNTWAQNHQNIHILGQSLGGALALMSHDLPNVHSVTCVNPALPSKDVPCKNCRVIFNQTDTLSKIGVIPSAADTFQVSVESSQNIPKFIAHIQPWLSDEKSNVAQLSVEDSHKHRYRFWYFLYHIARPIAFFLVLSFYILHLIYSYTVAFFNWLLQPVSALFSQKKPRQSKIMYSVQSPEVETIKKIMSPSHFTSTKSDTASQNTHTKTKG